jgi:hypothetical protein
MSALAVTSLITFAFGGFVAFVWNGSFRYFNTQNIGGAALASLSGIAAFGLSLFAIAVIATQFETYVRADDRIVLGGFVAGLGIAHIIDRLRHHR